jgi:hypothetical protein
MTQADSVHSTSRRTASKIKARKPKAKANESEAARSKIIEQCVIYVQCAAAHDAAFLVDGTGDSEYVDGANMKKSDRALVRLNALSSQKVSEAPPLTALELYAKSKVLDAMYGLKRDAEPNEIELAYIRFFAGEVSDYFIAGGEVKL